MPDDQGGPALGPTLSEWLNARQETAHHLAAGMIQTVDEEWVQRLADLLATERSWQDQYTALVALGSPDGRFPTSNR